MIKVVNKYKHTVTDNDFYIGRGSPLGNPYSSVKDKKTLAQFTCDSREESIEKYREYLVTSLLDDNIAIRNELNKIYRASMKGDVYLVCFCSPKPCHGDVIKNIIEEKKKELNIPL